MPADRGLSLLIQPGQWARCTRDGTVPLPGGGVELAWTVPASPLDVQGAAAPGGLAFDRGGTAYRTAATGVLALRRGGTEEIVGGLRDPGGLALDHAGLLNVADTDGGAALIVEPTAGRHGETTSVRVVTVAGRPLDVAPDRRGTVVLCADPPGLWLLTAAGIVFPRELIRPCYPHGLAPIRVAPGPLVLWRAPDGGCALARPDGTVLLEPADATDVEVLPDGTVVVAGPPGAPFLPFDGADLTPLEPLGAPDYDGGAIAADPHGRIAYTTPGGIRWTIGSVAQHVTEGTVITAALDGGADRIRWGRAFLTACLPTGTTATVRFATGDEATADVRFDGAPLPVYRRPAAPDPAWETDGFAIFEAPVTAPRGRYLWIEITLRGTRRVTPRLRAIRVERPGHTLLDALPRAYSRDDGDADFLFRMLAPAEGMFRELQDRSAGRDRWLDPVAAPADQLAWLAGFVGLALDTRWSESARRTLIGEAYALLRGRGTVAALARTVEIYLGRTVAVIEDWRLRGLGGTVLGTTPVGPKAPTIGWSMRRTGMVSRFMIGGTQPGKTLFDAAAHRYTVVIPGKLTSEQFAVVRGILDSQAPAHTIGTIREVGAGMRVGTARVGLTTFVGTDDTGEVDDG